MGTTCKGTFFINIYVIEVVATSLVNLILRFCDLQGNKIIDTLKTTPLSYPDLCTHLFDGTAATGVSGWGRSSKRSRTIDLNDDIENLGTEEVQSNNANPNDVEIPKKKRLKQHQKLQRVQLLKMR